MYKIFTIFIAVVVTSCLAQRALRFRNKRIPYEDDDYRDNNGDYDDDRPNDVRDMRQHDQHNGNRFNLHDMNRQTHFDVGGGRDPPIEYGFRGFGPYAKPSINQLQPQPQPQPQAQHQQPVQQAQQQPQQPQALGYDGGRAGAFGYTPYGHYTYNPYGYRRPGWNYGWNRPTQGADSWRGGLGLGFPFNLLGLGGGGGGSAYRPWWSGNHFGLFF